MFNSEQKLVDSFINKSKNFLAEITHKKSINRYFMLEEFNSTYGIADIVLGTYRPYLSKRIKRHTINENWVSTLSNFEINETIDIDEFMSNYYISRGTAIKKLNEYSKANFIKPIAPNKYKIIKEYSTITDTVIAIEAKLKNWQKALKQAVRYKKFSHYSFVLMDEKYSKPALNNLDIFASQNIGFLTMNDKEEYAVHYIPEKKTIKDSSPYYVRLNEAAYSFFKHH